MTTRLSRGGSGLSLQPRIEETTTDHDPESLIQSLRGLPGRVLLRSYGSVAPQARYSLVAARPFLTLTTKGSCARLQSGPRSYFQFGTPWRMLEELIARYELLDPVDWPFPLGGCFGYWGYDLKNYLEPRLPRRALDDLSLPDCRVGFYPSLVVFDHYLNKTWIVATGLQVDGSRSRAALEAQSRFWRQALAARPVEVRGAPSGQCVRCGSDAARLVQSSLTRDCFLHQVVRALGYIRLGHIYQVNLAQRLALAATGSGWELFRSLGAVSPSPFAAYFDAGEFELVSSSPELFLRLSDRQVLTRPIKGTRPRSADPKRDAELARELQTSSKEMAELVMITDLLRNDLGRICEYGSVQVPELVRLERYRQVQHLVSTVEGRLRSDHSHLSALAHCFPGGSITGAPKVRAMEIIDELEPVARGPYTGCLGYLGFNRESQLSILIRTALCTPGETYFSVGAAIVADSDPDAEYEETLAKAQGFLAAALAESSLASHV